MKRDSLWQKICYIALSIQDKILNSIPSQWLDWLLDKFPERLLKYLHFSLYLLPLLIVIFGVAPWQSNRDKSSDFNQLMEQTAKFTNSFEEGRNYLKNFPFLKKEKDFLENLSQEPLYPIFKDLHKLEELLKKEKISWKTENGESLIEGYMSQEDLNHVTDYLEKKGFRITQCKIEPYGNSSVSFYRCKILCNHIAAIN